MSGVDPTLAKPVTVRVFVPKNDAVSLPQASFRPKPTEDGDREGSGGYDNVHLTQIRFGFAELTRAGRLPLKAKKRLQSCLRR